MTKEKDWESESQPVTGRFQTCTSVTDELSGESRVCREFVRDSKKKKEEEYRQICKVESHVTQTFTETTLINVTMERRCRTLREN